MDKETGTLANVLCDNKVRRPASVAKVKTRHRKLSALGGLFVLLSYLNRKVSRSIARVGGYSLNPPIFPGKSRLSSRFFMEFVLTSSIDCDMLPTLSVIDFMLSVILWVTLESISISLTTLSVPSIISVEFCFTDMSWTSL